MTVMLWRKAGEQFFDENGQPLAGGKLVYTYADTDLPYPTFKDAAQTVPHPSPIVLDASGRLVDPIYVVEDDFKEVLLRGEDSMVFEQDDYPGAAASGDTGGVISNVQVFATPGLATWQKPQGATWVHVQLIAGGGGGGSGRKGPAGTHRCGGGGGEGGEFVEELFRASDLSETETVSVGAKGLGGAAVTNNSTNGNDGTAGGDTTFGAHLRARGGRGGRGGTQTDGYGAASRSGNAFSGEGANASPIGAAPEAPRQPTRGGGGGGAGGSITAANVLGSAGDGASGSADNPSAPPGGAAGVSDGESGAHGTNLATVRASGGPGGGGGKAGRVNPGGPGGNGGKFGGGGGGGGAGEDGVTDSGKGGDGADGIAIIRAW